MSAFATAPFEGIKQFKEFQDRSKNFIEFESSTPLKILIAPGALNELCDNLNTFSYLILPIMS